MKPKYAVEALRNAMSDWSEDYNSTSWDRDLGITLWEHCRDRPSDPTAQMILEIASDAGVWMETYEKTVPLTEWPNRYADMVATQKRERERSKVMWTIRHLAEIVAFTDGHTIGGSVVGGYTYTEEHIAAVRSHPTFGKIMQIAKERYGFDPADLTIAKD